MTDEMVKIRWAFCAGDMSRNGTEDMMEANRALNLQMEGRVVILGGPEAAEVDAARAEGEAQAGESDGIPEETILASDPLPDPVVEVVKSPRRIRHT